MKKYLILTLTFLMLNGFAALSQEEEETTVVEEEEVVDEPIKGGCLVFRFTGSVNFGRDNFLTSGLSVPASISSGSNYGSSAPAILGDIINESDNSAVNMIGVEGRMFITDEIAVKLSGGAAIQRTPAQEYIQGYKAVGGVVGGVGNAGVIPEKLAVPKKTDFIFNTTIGGEYHFRKKNLSPYLGVAFPFYYVRKSQYDPTYKVDASNKQQPIQITDVGIRIAEMFGFGAQAVAGLDYYFKSNFYMGFEIKPFSFIYAYTAEYPAPGLPSAKASSSAYGIFTQPLFKIGFVFN